ncbi:MAG: TIGR02281 family clan AA aspartic protease [Sphingomonadaceae bacterium]
MNQLLLPIGFILLVGAVFIPRDEPPVAPVTPVAAPPAPVAPPLQPPSVSYAAPPTPIVGAPVAALPAAMTASSGDIVIVRSPDGHFYTDALVNGSTVRFMIDTGATSVALSRADADRIGLGAPDEAFSDTAMGAGGAIAVRPVMLDRVAVGSLEATAVKGSVVKAGLTVSLLGQSWLAHLRSVRIEGDRMMLR